MARAGTCKETGSLTSVPPAGMRASVSPPKVNFRRLLPTSA